MAEIERKLRASREDKVVVYERLCGGVPDAIIILSGGIIRSNQEKADGRRAFKSPSYSEAYQGLVIGAKARIIATAELSEVFPESTIVTTSAVDPNEPTHASVMEKELTDMGVPLNRIMKEEVSWNTFSEMAEMVKWADRMDWRRLAVITNGYHVPRAKEMFSRAPGLISESDDPEFHEALGRVNGKLSVVFVSAEEILPLRHKSFRTILEAVYSSGVLARSLEAEAKGINDLLAGKYKFRPRKNTA